MASLVDAGGGLVESAADLRPAEDEVDEVAAGLDVLEPGTKAARGRTKEGSKNQLQRSVWTVEE